MKRICPILFLCAMLIAGAEAVASECPRDAKKPLVLVKAKTPIRRGPGLNYQVSSFLEEGRCLPFSEVSMDKRWVLISADEVFGWVPTGRLGPDSQAVAYGVSVQSSAVGSGQSRGEARVIKQTILLSAPHKSASPKRIMPVDLMVVPLSTTPDGDWVEVRDERGQTGWVLVRELRGDALAKLPIHEEMADWTPPPSQGPVGTIYVRPGRSGVGVALTAAVYGGALVPTHSFDSDGEPGRRRYDITAVAPSTSIELEMMDLGPLSARMGFSSAFITGVEADGGQAAGGNQYDVAVRVGLPLNVGPGTLTPELGYRMGIFDFDAVLSDQPLNVTFLSTTAHVATLGARYRWFLNRTFALDADLGLSGGKTSLSPRRLDEGGTTMGAYGSLGAQYFLGDIMGITTRYIMDWRQAEYTGGGQLDPTITRGTVTDLSHGLMVGLSFLLAG